MTTPRPGRGSTIDLPGSRGSRPRPAMWGIRPIISARPTNGTLVHALHPIAGNPWPTDPQLSAWLVGRCVKREAFYTLAANRSDPNDRLIGERMIGTSQHYLGDQLSARRHIELH
jgi:hypothetical protein